ncbi:MAG: hypothetical protein MHMPM18_002608 [Marteilia pararefringens]
MTFVFTDGMMIGSVLVGWVLLVLIGFFVYKCGRCCCKRRETSESPEASNHGQVFNNAIYENYTSNPASGQPNTIANLNNTPGRLDRTQDDHDGTSDRTNHGPSPSNPAPVQGDATGYYFHRPDRSDGTYDHVNSGFASGYEDASEDYDHMPAPSNLTQDRRDETYDHTKIGPASRNEDATGVYDHMPAPSNRTQDHKSTYDHINLAFASGDEDATGHYEHMPVTKDDESENSKSMPPVSNPTYEHTRIYENQCPNVTGPQRKKNRKDVSSLTDSLYAKVK